MVAGHGAGTGPGTGPGTALGGRPGPAELKHHEFLDENQEHEEKLKIRNFALLKTQLTQVEFIKLDLKLGT